MGFLIFSLHLQSVPESPSYFSPFSQNHGGGRAESGHLASVTRKDLEEREKDHRMAEEDMVSEK